MIFYISSEKIKIVTIPEKSYFKEERLIYYKNNIDLITNKINEFKILDKHNIFIKINLIDIKDTWFYEMYKDLIKIEEIINKK